MTFASEMLAAAQEIINDPEIGGLYTLTQRRQQQVEPGQPWRTRDVAGSADGVTVRAVILPQSRSARRGDGGVLSNDQQALVTGDATTVRIEQGDTLTDQTSGAVWSVSDVAQYEIVGTSILYDLLVRR